ncbi:copper chaperone PCu(A)C [Tateyamaria sp. syn59]|uniref:copper chaperone PCu(A)C n=1 Tax=Tateyamaria sp. syn59 TaxID=2576942 RepID=UPI0011BD4691|nr:copper chaperone PCu(A)C [Tateyamaria sp. syn59]
MKRLILASALTLCATAALSHDFKSGSLIVDHPMAFPTMATAMSGAGYFSVTNTGTEDDRLIGIRADFPRVTLHGTTNEDGVMRMFDIDAIDIPAGETVGLEPGGKHIMFMGLSGDTFEVGDEIPATLVFEKAGEIDVVFYVEPRGGASDEVDHSAHN